MANQIHETDGHLRAPAWADLVPGAVLRPVGKDGSQPAFSDCVVLGVDLGRGTVKLARPFLYATLAGTACPSSLTGVEEWEVSLDRVLRQGPGFDYMLVTMSTGLAASMVTR